MSHKVLYFTGTGNSLWIARLLCRELGSEEPASLLSSGAFDALDEKEDSLGIVFPVYMHRIPRLVADTLVRLPKSRYLYALAVNAGDPGIVFRFLRSRLKPSGNRLSAGFSIETPSNYLPFGEAVQGDERESLLQAAAEKVTRIAGIIKSSGSFFDKESGWFRRSISPGILYTLGYKYIPKLDASFRADDTCTSCGICEQVCPVKNVRLADGKPVWHRQCQMCMACLNLCPEASIQFGDKTSGLKRYRNPFVTLSDIIAQRQG